ncbi:MAG: ATPase [Methanobacteriota archaeon]|nr:MAG: ATPase [Euryarchaeota archaeon]
MKIAVASGKGGTGKTMVAANLAYAVSFSSEVTLADCDVEEPNLHLFFPSPARETTIVSVQRPVIDEQACDRCGRCADFCRYGAIAVTKDRTLMFPALCHSCGGCTFVCPRGAVHEEPAPIGRIICKRPLAGITLVSGILDEGQPIASPLIRAVKEMASGTGPVIYDCAPGTSCAVVETLDGCDACILVTESTPFGLHDLSLATDVARRLGVPAGVVINRSDGCDRPTLEFCQDKGLPVLMTIPFERWIAAVQNNGQLITAARSAWRTAFTELFARTSALAGGGQ